MNFWIALSNAKIEEIICLTTSIKKEVSIGFVNDVERNIIFHEISENWFNYFRQLKCTFEQIMKRIVFETRSLVNLNTFLLSIIKFCWENNSSYKEKTKRWVNNNRELNLLLLKQITDEIYAETNRIWTLLSSENNTQEIKVIQNRILRIQNLFTIIKNWF